MRRTKAANHQSANVLHQEIRLLLLKQFRTQFLFLQSKDATLLITSPAKTVHVKRAALNGLIVHYQQIYSVQTVYVPLMRNSVQAPTDVHSLLLTSVTIQLSVFQTFLNVLIKLRRLSP